MARAELTTKVIERLGPLVMRLWIGSLRIRAFFEDPLADPASPDRRQSFIYPIWHETLLVPTYFYRKDRGHVLVSNSRDGEYITRIIQRLGWQVIRGSSSRGGATAVRHLLETAEQTDRFFLAVTADGPRGPRRQLKKGVLYLASRTGMGIAPSFAACDRPWRARSWDRFMLPRPFSRARICVAAPIYLPAGISEADFSVYQERVQSEMTRMRLAAEGWLAGDSMAPAEALSETNESVSRLAG